MNNSSVVVCLCLILVGLSLVPGNARSGDTAEASMATFQHAPFADKEGESWHSADPPGSGDLVADAPELCFECHELGLVFV